jgi:hypothetical protein
MLSDSTGEAPVHPGPPKGLLRLVKSLGVVMVLLFLALISGIIWKATHKSPPPAVADVVMELGIDPASIRHMALDGGNLAIATDKVVLVIDMKQRKVILRSSKP